jgi:thiamine-monophosphate kinase
MAAVGELALIESIRERAGRPRGGSLRLGIGDDCAILQPPTGCEVLITTDFTLEGRHFRRDWHPAVSVGHRCLLRGLSDIAAMGGKPMAAFLSLAVPAGFTAKVAGRRWVDGFLTGLMDLAAATRTPLAGGDTAAAPGDAILADIVVLGSVPRGTALRRSGARAGDAIYVTGALGGAAAELQALAANPRRFRQAIAKDGDHPHLFPVQRLAVADRLRRIASSAMDVSDGISTDLRHLCEESGTGAVVQAAALPLHPLLSDSKPMGAIKLALHGGEDYELLFTVRPGARVPRQIAGVPLTRIGEMTSDRRILLEQNGKLKPLKAEGWEHRL